MPPLAAPALTRGIPVELAAQLEGVLQANLSLQAAAGIADADSGDVSVYQDGQLAAGLDGIDANSEAVAKADVEQEADQSNKDSKEIDQGPDPGWAGYDIPADHGRPAA